MNTEQFSARADFLPEYPENSQTGHFAGLFQTFYEALDDLCEFHAPNVSRCHVGSRIKDMLRGMKRYLTKMSPITWFPGEFKSWFESREKKLELERSRKKNTQGKKKKDGKQKPPKTRSTSKKKRQTGPISQSKGVNTYTKVRQQLQEPRRQKPDPLGNKNHRRAQQAGHPLPGTAMVPFRCGQCQKEYKNLKSYMTHMYQTHKKYIPPGSSHDIHGQILLTPLTKPSRSPTKPDQTQYPGHTPVVLPPLPSCHLDPSRDQVLAFKADLDKECGQEVMTKFTEEQIDALILVQWRRTLKKQGKIQEEKSEQPQRNKSNRGLARSDLIHKLNQIIIIIIFQLQHKIQYIYIQLIIPTNVPNMLYFLFYFSRSLSDCLLVGSFSLSKSLIYNIIRDKKVKKKLYDKFFFFFLNFRYICSQIGAHLIYSYILYILYSHQFNFHNSCHSFNINIFMDPSTQWKELNKKYYKFHQFNPITGEQKYLDFYYQHIAVAKWGGPLAATKNYDQVILMRTDDILKDSIVFFSNSGKIISRTPYKEADRIPLFDFLEDEHLILLKASGIYFIIDPFKGTKKNHDLGEQFRLNPIQKALVVNNGFILIAMNFEFYYIQNAHEPEVQQFKASNLTQSPEHWQVIPSQKSASGKVELLIANPDGGILHIIENEKWKIYYNKDKITSENDKKLPDLRNIKMLSLSPTYKNLALLQYYGQRWIIAFISNYFESSEYCVFIERFFQKGYIK